MEMAQKPELLATDMKDAKHTVLYADGSRTGRVCVFVCLSVLYDIS